MSAAYTQLRNAALRQIEARGANLAPAVQDRLELLVRTHTSWTSTAGP